MAKRGSVFLFIGMAGSGKTSLVQRLATHLREAGKPPYIVNLDPATQHLPYEANIDIRDTVNYKAVMKEYGLGPNGAILTSANLFATRFDKVVTICNMRAHEHEHFFVDTPGQIEIFTWSASGMIVTEMLASDFCTTILFVLDTPQCQNPQFLTSNLLQAVSVLYRSRLSVVLVFNKIDVASHNPLTEWLSDMNLFQNELDTGKSYAATLSQSLNMILKEFYDHLKIVGVSAAKGNGIQELVDILQNSYTARA